MQRSTDRGQALVVSTILIAIVAALAALAYGASPAGEGAPDPSSSPAPSERPVATPTVAPSPSTPVDGDVVVELDIATDHDVSVVVDDATGRIVAVRSGRAGDGMSVRWFDVKVENVDATTIRITWVGLPVDEEIALTVTESDGSIALDFAQAGPPAYSDAVGFDRVLEIEFDAAVDAADVEVTFPAPQPA